MHFSSAALLALQAASAAAWQVIAYDNVAGCAAAGDTTYRLFEPIDPAVPAYGGCNGWGPPPSGVTCREYQQGGAVGPLDCNGDFTEDPMSIMFHPLTQASVTYVGSLETWSQGPADCSSEMNQGDFSGTQVNKCFDNGLQSSYRSWAISGYGTIDAVKRK